MPFFKRRHSDPIEQLLAEHRPEPSDDLMRSLLGRLEGQSRRSFRPRTRPGGLRLVAAAGLTLLALVGATAAAGGIGAASHGLASFANVQHTLDVHSATNDTKNGGQGDKSTTGNTRTNGDESKDDDGNGSGDHQYTVKICHATGSTTNPYVELTLSPQGAAQHLAHHPGDFLAPPEGCPGAKHH
jgi:hypothetical protein